MADMKSKRLSLIVLGVLMAVMGLLALGVAGQGLYQRYSGASHRDAPKIMILTHDILDAAIDANKTDDQENLAFNKEILNAVKANPVQGGKGDNDPKKGAEPPDPHNDRNLQMKLLNYSMEDGIALTVSDLLRHSHLFKPVAGGLVSGQLAQLHSTEEAAAQSKNIGPVPKTADLEKINKAVAQKSLSDSSFKVIAGNLGAQYILTIQMVEPKLQVRLIKDTKDTRTSSKAKIELSARPVVHVEAYAVNGNDFTASKEIMLPGSIHRTVVIDRSLPEANMDSDVSEAANEMVIDINKFVGQAVVEWLVNEVAPSRVVLVNNGQFTIDRGSNDGVRVGAVYQVLREVGSDISGEGVDGSQRSLGKQRIPVGSITISGIDTLKAYATVASGGPIQAGDIVAITGFAGGDGASAHDAALGTQELAQAGPGGSHKVQLAVDDISYDAGGQSGSSNQLAEIISAALARDPRVTVIPRAEMQNVVDEREHNAQSSGDQDAGGVQGMATSNFLVSGSFSSASSRHARTISAGGITETTSNYTTTAVSGTLRVTSTGGVLKFTTTVGGGSPQEVAQAAARQLLVLLFPTQVVQVSGQTVVLDRGQDAGMQVGTRLSLFHVGKPIVDKQTGAVHEGVRIPAGEVVVQTVQPTISTAALQGGATAQEGDIALVGGSGRAAAAPGAPRAAPSHPVAHRAAHADGKASSPQDGGMHF